MKATSIILLFCTSLFGLHKTALSQQVKEVNIKIYRNDIVISDSVFTTTASDTELEQLLEQYYQEKSKSIDKQKQITHIEISEETNESEQNILAEIDTLGSVENIKIIVEKDDNGTKVESNSESDKVEIEIRIIVKDNTGLVNTSETTN